MRWCWLFVGLLAVGCGRHPVTTPHVQGAKPAAESPPADDAAAAQERAKLQGSWRVVSIEAAGQKVPDERVRGLGLVYVFTGDKLAIRRPDRPANEGTYRLDPAHTPKRLEFAAADGLRRHMVYELAGDTLTLCVMVDERAANQYPKALASQASPKTDLLTLEREKH
jgi:uncharacterized protein (TIGR03067 family)